MGFERFKKPINLPVRVCFIIIFMLIAQGIIVELFLFSIINNLMNQVPVKLLPKVSGILLHFNNYYLPIFILTSLIFAMCIFFFVKRLTSPLERLVNHSKDIASGDLSKRIILRKNDDLFEIGNNINILAEKLENIQTDFKNIYESLIEYSRIGLHVCNIMDALEGLSEDQEKSIQEDKRKLEVLCAEIDEKATTLKNLFDKNNSIP